MVNKYKVGDILYLDIRHMYETLSCVLFKITEIDCNSRYKVLQLVFNNKYKPEIGYTCEFYKTENEIKYWTLLDIDHPLRVLYLEDYI